MLRHLCVLALVLCGALACGSGGGSPSDSSAGASGSGGNDSPTGGGGGGFESVDGGTQAGGDGGNLGNGGSGGSTGGDPGLGGSTGGTGGSSEPMMPACPDDLGDMSMDSPCLLAGGWTKDVEVDLTEGHITITVSPGSASKQVYVVHITDDFGDSGLSEDWIIDKLPFETEWVNPITEEHVMLTFNLDDPDYFVLEVVATGTQYAEHYLRD